MVDSRPLPEIPPHILACMNKRPKSADTADALAVTLMQSDKESRACNAALVRWYREVQAANKAKG